MNKESIVNEILIFIQNKFSSSDIDIEEKTDRFDLLSTYSMDLILLSQHIESAYNVKIKRSDLTTRNFSNVINIAQLVLNKIK